MLTIVLASARPEIFRTFAEALTSDPEVRLKQAASGAEAVESSRTLSPHLVVIDSELPDAKPFALVSKLLMVNAMVNTAVVSPLSDEEFHESSEGLGILSRLPVEPDGKDALELLGRLRKIL